MESDIYKECTNTHCDHQFETQFVKYYGVIEEDLQGHPKMHHTLLYEEQNTCNLSHVDQYHQYPGASTHNCKLDSRVEAAKRKQIPKL